MGQDTVNAIVQAGETIGLGPAPERVTANVTNPQAFSQPGVQFFPNQVETEEPTVSFYGSAHAASSASHSTSTTIGSSAGTQGDGSISWNFGDGTTEVQPDEARFTHTFPGPGAYVVTASVTDNLGNTYSWTQSVRIDSPLSAAVVQTAGRGNSVVLSAVGHGGEGNVLSRPVDVLERKDRLRHDDHGAQASGRARDDHRRSRQHGNHQLARQLTNIVTRPAARTAAGWAAQAEPSPPSRSSGLRGVAAASSRATAPTGEPRPPHTLRRAAAGARRAARIAG